MGKSTIVPDGLALDAEGAVWIADCVNQRAARIAAGGEILDEVSTAPNGVFAVALGGEDGKTLFLSVAPDFDEAKRRAAREAFVTSATSFVTPVVKIDGEKVGDGTPGPAARRLREEYIRFASAGEAVT